MQWTKNDIIVCLFIIAAFTASSSSAFVNAAVGPMKSTFVKQRIENSIISSKYESHPPTSSLNLNTTINTGSIITQYSKYDSTCSTADGVIAEVLGACQTSGKYSSYMYISCSTSNDGQVSLLVLYWTDVSDCAGEPDLGPVFLTSSYTSCTYDPSGSFLPHAYYFLDTCSPLVEGWEGLDFDYLNTRVEEFSLSGCEGGVSRWSMSKVVCGGGSVEGSICLDDSVSPSSSVVTTLCDDSVQPDDSAGSCSPSQYTECMLLGSERSVGGFFPCDMCVCDDFTSYTGLPSCGRSKALFTCHVSESMCKAELQLGWVIACSFFLLSGALVWRAMAHHEDSTLATATAPLVLVAHNTKQIVTSSDPQCV